ncbi:MAG: hypothetical protein ACOCYT_04580 [Chloroflexota bacterium]
MKNQALEWVEGAGWLIFSGGADALGEIRAQALGRMKSDGGVAYIGLGADSADDLIEDMGELGAPTGFLIDVLSEDDDTIREQMREAALIVIPSEVGVEQLKDVLTGPPLESIGMAYRRGAVVLVEGEAVSLFGGIFVVENKGISGFDWVRGAYLLPGVTSIAQSPIARELLNAEAARLAVGIGDESALALGPGGAVEVLGTGQVTLVLAER